MSRSGYTDDWNNDWASICWRGAVSSAMRGKRGQAFLREMLAALDKIESRRLIANRFMANGEVCAIGAVGAARGFDMAIADPEDYDNIAAAFGIAPALAREIMYLNDEGGFAETPETRYARMRNWLIAEIAEPTPRKIPATNWE